ncbi:Tll0287-like domain-containing protein [Bowmanella dokdonensis]|uniref:DUF3365 domain-containing protein n=1 Tax=Bowmanella dokdonensis TaxID=751969 RepID=A0A939IPS2_9ALTE|nr:DUF3365 domain-containing protein [Bowmanella dokdonensis]MBN7824294.1 DUF3365 domain-containing protein [Bowmanella dokdonensis]
MLPTLLAVLIALPLSALAGENPTDTELEQQARAKILAFSGELKQALSSAMQAGGIEQAIHVCHEKAGEIAQRHSESGWHIARTSHRVRNPANRPDPWEQQQLQHFLKQTGTGVAPNSLRVSSRVELEGNVYFRYMQGIGTESLCLACHGKDLAPATQALLQEYYPQDQATGFSLGDLRGAFSLSKLLEQ